MSKKFFIGFDEVGNDWSMFVEFQPIEKSDPDYEAAIRGLVEYLNGLVERDTGRPGAVILWIREG